MEDFIARAKAAQADSKKLIEAEEKRIKDKRAAEAAALQKIRDDWNLFCEMIKGLNGYNVKMSYIYRDRGGWTVGGYYRHETVSVLINDEGVYHTKVRRAQIFGYGSKLDVSHNEETGIYTIDCQMCPRQNLIQFEDIKHGFVWTHEPPKIGFKKTFSTSEACYAEIEELIVSNLDLDDPKEKPKEPTPPTPSLASKDVKKPDVEVVVNNPNVNVKVR